MNKNKYLRNSSVGMAAGASALMLVGLAAPLSQAQSGTASPRERAGAVVFGEYCSVCHGVRLLKQDTAHDLRAAVADMSEDHFIRSAKTTRGAMPSFARQLEDEQLADVYAYVKRGHTPDLDDVRMESNH